MEVIAFDDALVGQEGNGSIQILCFVGKHEDLPGGGVVSQDDPLAIEDPSPWSDNWNSPQAIVLSQTAPLITLDDLEMGQFQVQEAENAKDQDQNDPGAVAKENRVGPDPHYRSR